MPTVSMFYGIIIRMFFDEHAPPHFHAQYDGFKATISIKELCFLSGSLPRRAQELVLEWAKLHQTELATDWDLCRRHRQPNPITQLK